MTTNTLLAVDGNSLVHRSFHALGSSGLTTRSGLPTWAVKGFVSQLLNVVERVGPDAIVVGFDDHTHSVRKVAHPFYKAQRKPKPVELGQQLQMTADLLRAAGVHVVVPSGLEADDVLASAAATAARAGWNAVIVTSDRDAFALIDDTTRVLRLITGGVGQSPLLSRASLTTMLGIDASQYRSYAAMRGDTSDNLPGIRGIGPKTAQAILTAFGTVEAAFDDLDSGDTRVTSELGKAVSTKLNDSDGRAAYFRNLEIMTMYDDIELGLDLSSAGAGLLPLEADAVSAALATLELSSLRGRALRMLTRQGDVDVSGDVEYGFVPDFADVPDGPEPFFDFPPPDEAPDRPEVAVTVPAMAGSTARAPEVWVDGLF